MKRILQLSILAGILLLAACGEEEVETTMSSDIGDFSATTQDGETLTNDDLLGEWWIADFIFTNCTTVCPPMTRNKVSLQKDLAEADVDNVQLVSFSVDPENDTPDVLKEYGELHSVDYSNWTFLTGYEFEDIETLSMESFKSPLQPPPEGDDQVTHGVRFFIVNPDGVIVHSYKGDDAEEVEQITEDIQQLQKQEK